jgi:hypothetical protein
MNQRNSNQIFVHFHSIYTLTHSRPSFSSFISLADYVTNPCATLADFDGDIIVTNDVFSNPTACGLIPFFLFLEKSFDDIYSGLGTDAQKDAEIAPYSEGCCGSDGAATFAVYAERAGIPASSVAYANFVATDFCASAADYKGDVS